MGIPDIIDVGSAQVARSNLAPLIEEEQYEEHVPQIEKNEHYATGGANGISNIQAIILASRTQYLRAKVDEIFTSLSGAIDADTLGGFDLNAIKTQIIDQITNGAASAYDTLLELQQAIEENDGDISGILSTLAQKANLGGSATQRFKVAEAQADDEAVSKLQLDEALAASNRLLMLEHGYIALDYHIIGRGLVYDRADYPALWAAVVANGLVQDEASWQADNTSQGMNGLFSSGDGSTTFRSPNLDGAVIKADSTRSVGAYEADDVKAHTHNMVMYASGGWSGCQSNGPQASGSGVCATRGGYVASSGGTETRVKTIALLPLIVAK